VIEHSVYVSPGYYRRGIGAALLRALIGSTEAAGIWTIQSSLFPENTGSLRLHQQAGFRVVGTRERIARHHGRWRDTVILERRSATAGTRVRPRPAGAAGRPARRVSGSGRAKRVAERQQGFGDDAGSRPACPDACADRRTAWQRLDRARPSPHPGQPTAPACWSRGADQGLVCWAAGGVSGMSGGARGAQQPPDRGLGGCRAVYRLCAGEGLLPYPGVAGAHGGPALCADADRGSPLICRQAVHAVHQMSPSPAGAARSRAGNRRRQASET
jgi:hypothetical protein